MKKSDFKYQLPQSLIAQTPLTHRSDSRLLCVNKNTGACLDKQFNDFLNLLKANDLLVFNDTQVIPARLLGKKQSGGHVEILIERIIDEHTAIAHLKASKSPKTGSIIELDHGLNCKVLGREHDLFKLYFTAKMTLLRILEEIGHIPLPPYITREDTSLDLARYQTVYAKQQGAVAAPTAGLHFDKHMMQQLDAHNIATTFVTLHVGSGTFQPVRVENLSDHLMHKEYFKVSESTVARVNKTHADGGRVIAIGTTVVRALESATQNGILEANFGETCLFITPGYDFKNVDAMLTNFHLPESTLLMLVSAFAGHANIMNAYHYAIKQHYRFFSYGDVMFLSA